MVVIRSVPGLSPVSRQQRLPVSRLTERMMSIHVSYMYSEMTAEGGGTVLMP